MTDSAVAGLRQRWGMLVQRLGGVPARSWTRIATSYAEPQRVYHTIKHIQNCLAHLDAAPELPERDLVEAALWLHDIIYDPGKSDNEERSALVAERLLPGLGIDEFSSNRTGDYVRLTRHDLGAVSGPGAWVVDIDLAILGSGPEAYAEYEAAIRQEYSWLTSAAYQSGRIAVLRGLLNRSRIYQTDHFKHALGERARHNLEESITLLAESPVVE